MKVVLLCDVKGVGKENDIVEVKAGYANNFLIKNKLALEANKDNLNVVRTRKKAEEAKAKQILETAQQLANDLKDKVITIPYKCGESGKLYGSVTNNDISLALEKEGYQVNKKNIILKDSIKTVGTYTIDLKLHHEVNIKINVKIEAL